MNKKGVYMSEFTSAPGQDPHKYFRVICKDFIKTIKGTRIIEDLQVDMQKMINASHDLTWKNQSLKDVFKKPLGEKIMDKVFNEFERYINDIKTNPDKANDQYLLDALTEVIKLSESQKIL
jgi:hypothetical protein